MDDQKKVQNFASIRGDSALSVASAAPERRSGGGRREKRGTDADEVLLHKVFNVASTMVFLIDGEGDILIANKLAGETLQVEAGNLAGRYLYEMLDPSFALGLKSAISELEKSGEEVVSFEADREGKTFLGRVYPVHHHTRGVVFAVFVSDISSRKLMQAELQETEEKYRKIFENATEGIFQATRDGVFLSANPSLAAMYGFDTPADLMSSITNIREQLYVNPADRDLLLALLDKNGSVNGFEVRMWRRDGTPQWILINARSVMSADGRVLYHEGTMQDITRRKEAEAALAESEERYRTAIEHSNDGVLVVRNDRNEYVNKRFVEMFGYDSAEELLGQPITIVVHPDDRERVMAINNTRRRGGPARYEFKGVTKKGATLYIEVSGTAISFMGRKAALAYLRDITQRKQAEESLIRSHQELEQLNRVKTKALDHIAHELKTPLSVIQGNLRLLTRRLRNANPTEKFEGILSALERNVDRLFRIEYEAGDIMKTSREVEATTFLDEIDRVWLRFEDFPNMPADIRIHVEAIKSWLRGHVPSATPLLLTIDILPFVESVVNKARHFASHRDVLIETEGVYDLYVLTDPAVLRDVLMGLLRNAVENTPDGGHIKVSVEEKDGSVWVQVTDWGTGITEENLQYIFDGLFHAKESNVYTSKRPYDFGAGGKGLDLLRMKIYARRFGFNLTVKSERCRYLPSDKDICPGSIAGCSQCSRPEDCMESGTTTFSLSFPIGRQPVPGRKE